ncbi:MAG TPA: hypothetical protein VHM91_19140, partial [Verrucomicrobiales bacterium]|nr:hypothetical protein [Verrucomicrobiales bacterium]
APDADAIIARQADADAGLSQKIIELVRFVIEHTIEAGFEMQMNILFGQRWFLTASRRMSSGAVRQFYGRVCRIFDRWLWDSQPFEGVAYRPLKTVIRRTAAGGKE